jgi:hypothetical protein
MFRLKVLGIILVLLVVLNVVTAVAGIHLDDSTRTGIIWGVIIIGFIGWLIYTPIENATISAEVGSGQASKYSTAPIAAATAGVISNGFTICPQSVLGTPRTDENDREVTSTKSAGKEGCAAHRRRSGTCVTYCNPTGPVTTRRWGSRRRTQRRRLAIS